MHHAHLDAADKPDRITTKIIHLAAYVATAIAGLALSAIVAGLLGFVSIYIAVGPTGVDRSGFYEDGYRSGWEQAVKVKCTYMLKLERKGQLDEKSIQDIWKASFIVDDNNANTTGAPNGKDYNP